MRAWTYRHASDKSPYWVAPGNTPVICLEYDDGRLEWRRVDTGEVFTRIPPPAVYYEKRLLDPRYYPAWYRDLDVYSVDEGL